MTDHHAARRERLLHQLRSDGLSALLVCKPQNVTYLTGFTGSDTYLIVSPLSIQLISDTRYTLQLHEECPRLPVEIRPRTQSLAQATLAVLQSLKLPSLAVEANVLSLALASELQAGLATTQLVPREGLIERLRGIKDSVELVALRQAVRLAEESLARVRADLQRDWSELRVAAEIEYQIRRLGGWGCSFEPIVAVGSRGALPHAPPTPRRISEADFVLVDWGACERLYRSDLTRVLVTGTLSAEIDRVYAVVLAAQEQAIRAIRPGASLEAVDRAARSVIEQAGFGKSFGHGLGHGIGLEVHEAPRIADGQAGWLESGMVVTVEPGIYLPGWGGVRIEDDVLVTDDGCEVLTTLPKQLEECVLD